MGVRDIDRGNLEAMRLQASEYLNEIDTQLNALQDEHEVLERGWDGAIVETIDIDVTESGGVVSLSLQADGGGDLTCRFAGVSYTLDCTPAQTVALTAGTDISPTHNYVYITESGGVLTLTKNTTGFPSSEHAPVATVMVQSAASVAVDGAYKVHAWTDHIHSASNNGHIQHVNEKLRALPAGWVSGTAPQDMVVSSPDAYLSTTAGVVFQLHDHTMPARDMQSGDPVFVVNDPTTAYKRITTLDDITQDASGGGINNKYMNLVLAGVVSEDETDCKVFLYLPTDTYTVEALAQTDADATAVYSGPPGFVGTIFLIARYTVRAQDSGAWVQSQKTDLRGLIPSTSPGGGAVTDHGALVNLDDPSHHAWAALIDGSRTMTGNLDMGDFDITNVGEILFDTSFVPGAHAEGSLHWNDDDGTLEVDMPGGEVVLQIGQELLAKVRNQSGALIANGAVVWNTGSLGNKPLIELADADAASPSRQTGMATEDIDNNSNGYVNLTGLVRELDTSAHAEGTSLYLSATTPGALTATPPTAPDHVYWICVVTKQHATEGTVYFKSTMPMQVSDLSDFNGTTPDATNKHFVWNDANSYWDAGQISHADLADLGADDHTQYLLADGSRAMTGNLDLATKVLLNAAYLTIDERASNPIASAGHGFLWVKNTSPTELWFTDDAGASTKIV